MFRPGNIAYAYSLIAIAVLLLAVFVINYYVSVIIPFNNEKKYIEEEIQRSVGRARRHWQKKLKKHKLTLVPFIGKWLSKKVK